MAQIRARTVQQRREEVCAAASFHCLVEDWHGCEDPKPKEQLIFVDKKLAAKKHRTEWCAAASNYRCMSCGWSSRR